MSREVGAGIADFDELVRIQTGISNHMSSTGSKAFTYSGSVVAHQNLPALTVHGVVCVHRLVLKKIVRKTAAAELTDKTVNRRRKRLIKTQETNSGGESIFQHSRPKSCVETNSMLPEVSQKKLENRVLSKKKLF